MILRLNPNRMELIRLRRRLALAQRGHDLLQDKLEEMMRRFLVLLKDVDRAHQECAGRMQEMLRRLVYCRLTSSREEFERSVSAVETGLALEISTQRIMNVRVPSFAMQPLRIEKRYDLFRTSGQLDVAVADAEGFLRSVLRLAALLKTLDILSGEIERTRRRVNALEYKLIPSIAETIRYINQKLNEFERGNLVRLMRIKEIVRSH